MQGVPFCSCLSPLTFHLGGVNDSLGVVPRPLQEGVGGLHIEVLHLQGILGDELASGLNIISHQGAEDSFRLRRIGDRNLKERAGLRVHRGLPELSGIHLPQALVALDPKTSSSELKDMFLELEETVHLRLILSLLHPVRRTSNIIKFSCNSNKFLKCRDGHEFRVQHCLPA